MEGLCVNLKMKVLKAYRRRRGYKLLRNFSGSHRPKNRRFRSNRRPRRFWRIRIAPKLRILHPKKLFSRLQGACFKLILCLSNSSSRLFNGGFGSGAVVSDVNEATCNYNDRFDDGGEKPVVVVKEYEKKIMFQIYRTLMAQGQLVVPWCPAMIA